MIVVGTPQHFQYLMDKDKINFISPGRPWVIVKKLTKEIIQEAIQAYMNDLPEGYWLKLYHFAYNIDINVFDELQAQQTKKNEEFKQWIELNM